MKKQFALLSLMGSEGALSKIHELIRELKIAPVMSTSLLTLSPDNTMAELKIMMRQHRISGVPVVQDNNELVGVVSLEDLIRAMEAGKLDTPVREFMTTQNLVTAYDQETLMEALRRLESTHVGRIPVLNSRGKLVGIITRSDVMAALIKALQDVYDEAELLQGRPQYFFEALESEGTNLSLRYHITSGDFTHGGEASAKIKQALLRIGATVKLARRVAIAAYEAEMNLVIHATEGGILLADIRPTEITIVAQDSGPGISDVDEARQPGYSTASPQIREMGFGAGMGLTNIERCSDEMSVWSIVGVGTRVQMSFKVSPEEAGK
ncbi:MAG: CBS domain-containing protein [Anaerolineae bacterium]|nr:CBS domain-containing protein [Anaerolineae bacterium]